MSPRRVLWICLWLPACGRLGYEPRVAPADAGRGADIVDAPAPGPETVGAPTDTAAAAPEAIPPAPDSAGPDAGSAADMAAPAPDAAPAHPDAAPSLCARLGASAIECLDFDDPTSTLDNDLNAVHARDTTRFAAGTGSEHVTTDAGPSISGSWKATPLAPPIASGDIYMRAWYFIPASAVITSWVVGLEASYLSGGKALHVTFYPSGRVGLYVIDTETSSAPGAYPQGRWFCLELAINLHPSAGALHAYVDGRLVFERVNLPTALPGGVPRLNAGVITEGPNNPLEMWFDDYLATRTRVGCN